VTVSRGPRGRFIVFEGGEGAGKSTQLALLARRLTDSGSPPVITREPGGTTTAEAVRALLLAPAADEMSAKCEALLFAAARADHVAKVIEPALAEGRVVLCDRFVDSSLAYQGHARDLAVAEVKSLSRWATGGLVPDLTVLLDIDPAHGLARAEDGNRMEAQTLEFHRRVRAGLLALAADDPGRYLVISAEGSAAQIAEAVFARVASLQPRATTSQTVSP
jgi:dTMP kinase